MYLLTDHGVYYTSDFSGPGSGDPTWTLVDGGLPAGCTYTWLQPDPYRSGTRQYLLISNAGVNELYVRTGGNWSKLTDSTTLAALVRSKWGGRYTPPDLAINNCIMTDINQDGFVGMFVRFWGQALKLLAVQYIYIFCYSTDYGATWNLMPYPGAGDYWLVSGSSLISGIGQEQIGDYAGTSGYAAGNIVYLPLAQVAGGNPYSYLFRSVDKGLHWTFALNGEVAPLFDFTVAVFNTDVYQNTLYCMGLGVGDTRNYFKRSTDNGATWSADLLDAACTTAGTISIYKFHALYNPSGSYASTLRVTDANDDVWKSTDSGATWIKYTHDATAELHDLGISLCHDSDGKLYGLSLNSADDSDRAIWCSVDEGETWEDKAGANAGTAPYTNSIPGHAKAIVILQVFN